MNAVSKNNDLIKGFNKTSIMKEADVMKNATIDTSALSAFKNTSKLINNSGAFGKYLVNNLVISYEMTFLISLPFRNLFIKLLHFYSNAVK